MHYRRTSHDDCALCGSRDPEWTVNPKYAECPDCRDMLYEEAAQDQNVHPKTLEDQSTANRQVGGTHYKDLVIEPWDVIRAWEPSLTGFQIYLWGNTIKYLSRLGRKGSVVEDVDKTIHYLQKLREELTGE